jgi:hypothetical protein
MIQSAGLLEDAAVKRADDRLLASCLRHETRRERWMLADEHAACHA